LAFQAGTVEIEISWACGAGAITCSHEIEIKCSHASSAFQSSYT
jgi:hypothetical protein